MKFLRNIADTGNPASLAAKLRRRRFAFFQTLVDQLKAPVRILDVGGTEGYWKNMGFHETNRAHVTLLNLASYPTTLKNVDSLAGDARNMPEFRDGSFDIVYSNSVIEHVGTFGDQQRMAKEVQRVGKRYFVQTPSKYFPIEPHFLFPLFQFLPRKSKIWIASHYRAGWACHPGDPVAATKEVDSIRLLSEMEMKRLFPKAQIYRERLGGLTKSIVAYGGWPPL
jgi:hypothetical protein